MNLSKSAVGPTYIIISLSTPHIREENNKVLPHTAPVARGTQR
jgi:hypothetical protein